MIVHPLDAETVFYSRGMAWGCPDIKRDSLVFRFREECYELPCFFIARASSDGGVIVAPIEQVRGIGARLNGC